MPLITSESDTKRGRGLCARCDSVRGRIAGGAESGGAAGSFLLLPKVATYRRTRTWYEIWGQVSEPEETLLRQPLIASLLTPHSAIGILLLVVSRRCLGSDVN